MDRELRIVISLMLVICAILVVVFIITKPTTKEFVPPDFDEMSVIGFPSVDNDSLQFRTINCADKFSIAMCGTLVYDSEARISDVWFTNPSENTIWLQLIIMDAKGNQIASTGLLRPGEYVKSIVFDIVPEGDFVMAKVISYAPETYYSEGTAQAQLTLIK